MRTIPYPLAAALFLSGALTASCASDEGTLPEYHVSPLRDARADQGSGDARAADDGRNIPGDDGGDDSDARPSDAPFVDVPAGRDTSNTADGGAGSDGGSNSDTDAEGELCVVPGFCDPLGPNTCGAGNACRVLSGRAACSAIAGIPVALGDLCQSSEQCAHGLVCINLGQGARCTQLCHAGSIGECGADRACTIELQGQACLRLCAPLPVPCDIYNLSSCGLGQKCGLARNPETALPYTGCVAAGPGQVGDPCASDTHCSPGTLCVTVMGTARCHQICGPNGSAPVCLVSGQTCTGLTANYNVPFCR